MTKSNLILIPALLLAGAAIGVAAAKWTDGEAPVQASGEREVLYWKAPMDPNFRRDTPGKSPMGMDLVPVYADEQGDDENLVQISATVENNIGVRTDKVVRTDLARNIKTVGFIQIDEDKTASVDVRTQGWVENLLVKSVGEPVKKGQPLFDLYSKPLVTAQEEYLQAKKIDRASLINAAKSRLRSLGLSRAQITRLSKTGKVQRLSRFYAPQDGIVTMIGVGEGAFVKPGTQIMMLADLSTVWVLADVFETEAGWVKPGQAVAMKISAEPGRQWSGVVDYIYPSINPVSRTAQVRLRFDNADGALKPDGYANITIQTAPKVGVLAVDREAVIRTGHASRVILALGDGRFQPAEVTTGMEAGGLVEIQSGLQAGETIVVSAHFLLDSEASLRGSTLRMANEAPMQMSGPKEAEAKGVVVSLMANHGMITIEHEAVKAFGWPDMEMDFVTDPEALTDIQEGDKVMFKVLEITNDNDDFVITSISKMDDKAEDGQ
jgi:Cu(I)/Ag(I) efflux system membrane fusion protein